MSHGANTRIQRSRWEPCWPDFPFGTARFDPGCWGASGPDGRLGSHAGSTRWRAGEPSKMVSSVASGSTPSQAPTSHVAQTAARRARRRRSCCRQGDATRLVLSHRFGSPRPSSSDASSIDSTCVGGSLQWASPSPLRPKMVPTPRSSARANGTRSFTGGVWHRSAVTRVAPASRLPHGRQASSRPGAAGARCSDLPMNRRRRATLTKHFTVLLSV